MTRIGATVAAMTVSLTLSIALAIQIALMRFIPVFGDALGFLFTSWLYSLYCFEYTWTAQVCSPTHAQYHSLSLSYIL